MVGISGFAAVALLASLGGCNGKDHTGDAPAALAKTDLTVTTADGTAHRFTVEVAATESQQQQGLMYRPPLAPDAGMLFAPYPPDGGPPKVANFWMKNTPSPLDILFIRVDRTIATVAENTVPFSEAPVPSGEPIAAVLELGGGRAAELGIAAGDKVAWK
ncbi:DUF192 domain-containing protein [uncultured Sphingomonas sp.]|uniref:DUF192 domain-containing protein n=1 Tax=uncultured Sphingomonas sp. TaxID=158754 RepID=UPI0025907222|nr:DUF192 domain-containing protein [uncultured Sphingomonas sp.]